MKNFKSKYIYITFNRIKTCLIDHYILNFVSGECNVLTLSKAGDGKFKDVMKKVGMAKNSSHVHQFKDTLLEWAKDPGES